MALPPDKVGHLKGGAIIACLFGVVFGATGGALSGRMGALVGLAAALLVVVFCGAAKEYLDSLDTAHHKVELLDFVATVLGGLIVLVPLAAATMWIPVR